MTDQSRPDQAGQAFAQSTPGKSKSQVPTKKLPSPRLNFVKQLNLIRAFGIEGMNGAPAKVEAVAKLAEMVPTSVGLLNPFLVENGFIERTGTGEAVPAGPVVEFARAYSWAPETASTKLAPIIRRTWFGTRLLNLLAFRPMAMDQAVHELAADATAGPEYKDNIELLIDYSVAAGIVRRDGNQLSLGDSGHDTQGAAPAPAPQAETAAREEPAQRSAPASAAVATGFASTQGGIQFHVGLRVDMAEMAGWSPDRIAAFFAGVAQVLAAKHGIEEVSEK